MGRDISLFSGYAQKENRTTNYCLLLLRLIYEENPKFLAEFLSQIAGEKFGNAIGIQFRQQERKGKSVPDGVILQSAMSIYIETKNFNWFYDSQIEDHLTELSMETPGPKLLIALSNFEENTGSRFAGIERLCRDKYRGEIEFAAVSFEDWITELKKLSVPKNVADFISDFEAYIDTEGLISRWHRQMAVVNCATLPHEILEGKAYLCPAKGGAYNHQRSKFFGMYRWKRVEKVALIEAVVDLWDSETYEIRWKHVQKPDEDIVFKAREAYSKYRVGSYPWRVFLLGELFETDFRKDSKGGMIGSKQYFAVSAETVQELAEELNGKVWSQFR